MTINYMPLNKITAKNSTPMPKANIILRLIPTGGWYSSIDLKSGFWQIKMHPDSVNKTAFYANGNLYEWLVMPFGLKNAPATFVSLMNRVLEGYILKFCFVYVDDIIVFSKTFEEHLEHLNLIFKRLEEAGLTINADKSHFCKREITFLGHVITQNGLVKQPEKVRAITEFPTPRNVKEILRFHGMCQWYSSFIPGFAKLSEPMYRLLRKKVKFEWSPAQEASFQALKRAMCEDVMLHCLNYELPIFIRTDASDVGLGAVLVQFPEDKERVIYYASRTLNDSEKKLHACDKECLAIVWAINKFKDFVWGEEFAVLTDNIALAHLKAFHNKSKKLTRWAMEIEESGCKIVYCKGSQNIVADCLSRGSVDPLPNEPDHLEGHRDIYTPILNLTYNHDLLHRIRASQKEDPEVLHILQRLESESTQEKEEKGERLQSAIVIVIMMIRRRMVCVCVRLRLAVGVWRAIKEYLVGP
jgi:hypothetical protein